MRTVSDPVVPAKAGAREWIGLAVLTLPALLIALDFTVLHLALPHLAADLRPNSTQQLWIVDVYGFMIAGLLIPMGTLGDRIGRRRLLLIGGTLFAAASALAAYATGPEMLIAARALLGLTGATLLPSTLSLVTNMFVDTVQRRLAIGVWTTAFSLGGAAGPLIGGAMLEQFWWGSVFLLAIPVMALLLVLGPVVVPEYKASGRRAGIDMTSVALLMASLLPIVYGIKELAEDGVAVLPLAAIGGGIGLGIVFLRRQRVLADPLLDLDLFANRGFSVPIGAQTLSLFSLGAFQFFMMQYLQLVLGLSPLPAGLWTLPGMVLGVVGALSGSALTRWFAPAHVVTAGLAIAAVGFAIALGVGAQGGLAFIVVSFSVTSLTLNSALALAYSMILQNVPPERAGTASGTAETGNELGLALGVAIAGSIGTAVYRGRVTADTLPAALSPAEVEASRETLASAAAVADRLPDDVASAVLESTQGAFISGMQVTSGLLALLMAGLAIAVGLLLRNRPTAPPLSAADPR